MLAKLFDCQLHDGHPVVRIPVDVPESPAEVFAMIDPAHLASLAEAVPGDDPGHNLALAHEETRVATLRKLFDHDQTAWQRERDQLAAAADGEPLEGPATFEAAFPEIFERSNLANRFAQADAKAEYFRLYSLVTSTAHFTAMEVEAEHPAPETEHKNWTKIRKQKGLVGTERKADARKALVALRDAAVEPKMDTSEASTDA